MNKKRKLCVVGLGYVGLPLALLAEEEGYEVYGVDRDERKLEKIKKGISPFEDEYVSKKLKESSIEVGNDFSVVGKSDIVVICVPTPVYENHMPNLELVKTATREVSEHLKNNQLVILESTVNPGVSENVVLPIIEEVSGLKVGVDIYLAHCPERINPGDKKWNVRNISRVVGASCERGLEMAMEFYASIVDGEIKPMKSLKEAEAVKVVENSFRDINIAFVNELAMSFSRLGIDLENVIEGAATKPFAFMPHFPGCGVGGHCIPVDPYYLIEYAKTKGFEHDFLSLARRINSGMPEFAVNLLIDALNEKRKSLNGTKVLVLGISYKQDIDDTRESPSYEIIKHIKKGGGEVMAYDPFVPRDSDFGALEDALKWAEAMVVATSHSQFRSLVAQNFVDKNIDVVVDGRNCLDKDSFEGSGVVYKGIGR